MLHPDVTGDPYLKLAGVRKSFGKFTALKNIALANLHTNDFIVHA